MALITRYRKDETPQPQPAVIAEIQSAPRPPTDESHSSHDGRGYNFANFRW